MSGGWSRRDAASGAEVAAGLELALLSLCDRGKVIVAVHGLLAHMLAAVEQEESERYSDYRSEESAKLPVGCPVVSHQEPPIIRTHGANACLGSRFLRRTTRVELRQTCGVPTQRLTKMHGRPPRRPDIELGNVDDRAVGEIEPAQGR
jgi:hypothetical protein